MGEIDSWAQLNPFCYMLFHKQPKHKLHITLLSLFGSPWITHDLITCIDHSIKTRPKVWGHIQKSLRLFLPLAWRKNQERLPSSCPSFPSKGREVCFIKHSHILHASSWTTLHFHFIHERAIKDYHDRLPFGVLLWPQREGWDE